MKKFVLAAILSSAAGGALAGGLDRSGQGLGPIFESGNYLQLSYGMVMPSVSGVLAGVLSSGNMAPDYSQFSIGIRTEVNDRISLTVMMDQPFGAAVDYSGADAGYTFLNTTANVTSNAFTGVVRYKLSDRLSVHGGVRAQTLHGDASIPPVGGYTLDVDSDTGVGYVIGAAFEIPDIALRAAVTYNSPISHTMTGTEFGGPVSFDLQTPRSVNIDLQTGIAADTLLFGSIRWVEWSTFAVTPPAYFGITGDNLVDYNNDSISYSLGIGRRFSDAFSASIAVGYEAADGLPASNLSPTDGYLSVQLGGQYTMNDMKISGGVRYVKIGDAISETIGADFADNSAIGLGLSVGYSF